MRRGSERERGDLEKRTSNHNNTERATSHTHKVLAEASTCSAASKPRPRQLSTERTAQHTTSDLNQIENNETRKLEPKQKTVPTKVVSARARSAVKIRCHTVAFPAMRTRPKEAPGSLGGEKHHRGDMSCSKRWGLGLNFVHLAGSFLSSCQRMHTDHGA